MSHNAKLVTPPLTTVRIVPNSTSEATRVATALRALGSIATHPRSRTWVEVQGTVGEVKDAIKRADVLSEGAILWEPRTRSLERVGHGARSSPGRN